ncbi:hypothetical protein O6H91_05G109500 [Diphasiastrum complanatum]|uniref:Uncharacterized protein n=3 Tax=Diphasiastrum complanatum TaxID=34168 RepID=A0ACC2DNT2_DIPCM|nr:hypothetical protein O6H91_05G061400 [Diphasiastrum complanatum]KAJ7557043.1 hypothetical protein O6H91_05G109500 [Diphasiastrum complanatum]
MEYGEDRIASMLRKPTPSQIVVPLRVSGDGVFKPSEVSPSPMTLAASFLVDHDPDTEFRSFTSLMNAAPESPSFSTANKESARQASSRGAVAGGSFAERLAARGATNSGFMFDPMGFLEDVKPNADHMKMTPPSPIPINRSTCLTIPPGLSPTTLLDSPVLFSSYQAELSPTTGTYNFPTGFGSGNGIQMSPPSSESSKESDVEQESSSGFVFKPLPKQGSLAHMPSLGNLTNFGISHPQFPPQFEQPGVSRSSGPIHPSAPAAAKPLGAPSLDSKSADRQQAASGVLPPALEDMQGLITDHVPTVERPSEDGYNWRKYGQKQVKGSEYPRSYYKCTYANCPVKKKVERSHDGQVTEIVYKGEHNHPKPLPSRRLHGAASALQDGLGRDSASSLSKGLERDEGAYTVHATRNSHGLPPRANVSLERASSGVIDRSASGSLIDPGGNREPSTSSYSDDDEQGSRLSLEDGDEDGPNSKRRRMEALTAEAAGVQRTIREPRVVVQTTSEIDILEDGYRWRKYGQKVVKGNPHPRSYYKCTNVGCPVRKHVERASNDPKSVITTYEGKHNHDVPVAKASVHDNCAGEASSLLAQTAAFAPCIDNLASATSSQDQPSSFPRKTAGFGKFFEDDLKDTDMSMSATDLGMQLGINRATMYTDMAIKAEKKALSFSNSTSMNFADTFPSSTEDWRVGSFNTQDQLRRPKQEDENYLQPFNDSSSSALEHTIPPRLVLTP